VADGPHDQTGMYVMHHAFRRDLARFESAVRHTPVSDAATWRALHRRWAKFAEALHHHHAVEDATFWPIMLERVQQSDDEVARRTLIDMESEHGEIDPALASCAQGFADMDEHPCDDHRNALDVHVTATRVALLDHLRHEETEALPLLQRVMTADDYAACEAAAAKGYPPKTFPFLLPWMAAGLPADVVSKVLREAGPVFAVLLKLFRPGFERQERRAFRYA